MNENNSKKIVILLNDSDKLMAKVCRNKFQKQEGWESIITHDYDTAINEIKRINPNIVMTEIILASSQKDGFDLIKEVKDDKNLNKTIMVIFSELVQESDIKKAKDLGADEYFVKSQMTINEVIEKIKLIVK